ncbi:MAG: hypothetical protein V4527_11785 [Pseudomonadota bacterium]
MPEFFRFEARTENLAPAMRADRFVTEFAAKHPDFYEDKGLDWPAQLHDNALGLLDPAKLEAIPGFPAFSEARFHMVADMIDKGFAAAQTGFLATFPDFRCEAVIAFGPSFLRFDGHGKTDTQGQWHMLFGVDAISLEHGPEDMPVMFGHELFHIYHRQLMGAAARELDNVTWWTMWEEGLATYTSQRLNPSFGARQVLYFPQDIVQKMQAKGAVAHAAKLMLADFDKSDGLWFDTGRSAPGLPPRAGYYMGYLLASDLGRDHNLNWLARLSPDQVKRRVHAFLEAQSKAG